MKVTYFNVGLQQRCTLIDQIDQETAERVVAKVGNENDPFFYLPEVRIEEDQTEVAA